MQEIRDLLAKKSVDSPVLDDTLAAVLADAVTNRTPPGPGGGDGRGAASAPTSARRSPASGLDRLAEALRAAAAPHPALGTPRARGAVVAIQDTLRTRGGALGIVVGWLVRAGGSGRRGETLRLGDGRTLIGLAARLRDPPVAGSHRRGRARRGHARGRRVLDRAARRPGHRRGRARRRAPALLTDGETIGIGDGLFIFKSASAGNLSREQRLARRGRAAAERRAGGAAVPPRAG